MASLKNEGEVEEMVKSKEEVHQEDETCEPNVPYKITTLSDYILKYLAGKGQQKLKEIERELSLACAGSVVEIRLDFKHGNATIDAPSKYHGIIADKIEDKIREAKEKLRNGRNQIIGTDEKNTRQVVFGAGGEMQDILMPDEFNSFKFDCKTNEEPLELIKKLKEVKSVYPRNFTTKEYTTSRFETSIEFNTAKEASTAANFLQEYYHVTVDTNRKNTKATPKIQNQIQVKLAWQRTPITGYALINCESLEDAEVIYKVLPGKINIKTGHKQTALGEEKYRVLKPTKNNVKIDNVAKDTIPGRFKQQWIAWIHSLCKDVKIKDIVIPRAKGFETSPATLEDYKNKITEKIKSIIQDVGDVYIKKPANNDWELHCWITLQNISDREILMKEMDQLKLDEKFDAHIKSYAVASICISKYIMKVVESDLLSLLKSENLNTSQHANHKTLKNGSCGINISSNSIEGLIGYKTKIEQVITPTSIDCSMSNDKQQLFQFGGKSILQKVEKETDTLITTDFRNKMVLVYGTLFNRERAVQLIEDQVEILAGTVYETINLSGPGRPIGLMKSLLRTYGADLDELEKKLKLYSLCVNLRSHLVEARGSKESIEELQEIIFAISKEVGEKETEEVNEICSVCLCPADDDPYRLKLCGHLYCKPCLENLMNNSLSRGEIPIKCSSDDCTEAIMMDDLLQILNNQTENLIKASVDCYIMKNKDKVIPCPTPDCTVVHKLTQNACLLKCPDCQMELCTNCRTASHNGLSCAQNKSTLNDEGNVEKWLDGDKKNRGKCPSCNTLIERFDGCDKLTCAICKKNVCWRCKSRVFDSERECYDHLIKEHGGCFEYINIVDH